MQIKDKFFAENPQEIAQKVIEAADEGYGIVPCGKGTNIEKYLASANKPVVIISTEKMDSIQEFERDNLSVKVQAGITLAQLQKELHEHDVFLPLTVESHGRRTIGGLIAENEAGYEEYAYGKIQDYVLGLEFVTPYGEIVKTGGKTVKNVSGYDFTRLFANSLGTLGIITSITLKLRPEVEKRAAVILEVPSLKEASEISKKIIQEKLVTVTLKGYKDHENDKWRLIIGLAGFKETVKHHLQKIKKVLGSLNHSELDQAEVNGFWKEYYQKFPIYEDNNIVGMGDKRVLFKIAESCEKNNLFSQVAFSEVDFGAGKLIIKTPKETKETIKESLLAYNQEKFNFSFNFQKPQPGLIYKKIKTALDPNNLMFPNNRLTGGEYLG